MTYTFKHVKPTTRTNNLIGNIRRSVQLTNHTNPIGNSKSHTHNQYQVHRCWYQRDNDCLSLHSLLSPWHFG